MENETWGVEHTEDDQTLIVPHTFPADGIIATVNRAWPQYEQFATLIAAAPAMYEALAKLRLEAIHYRNTGVGVQFLNEAIAQAEQAINQVWGEGDHDTKREG